MATTLDKIVAARRRSAAASEKASNLRDLERVAREHTPRGFLLALETASKQGIAVIAELKKASPSRGVIRTDFHVEELARELQQAGAAALSVLTEEEHFQGSLANLRAASAATHLPCLRKDFIVSEFQLLEARAAGADAILLIAAALGDVELHTLHARAGELELDVLCEVHDEPELNRALTAGCEMIGVNNRDLHTLQVDLFTALRLAHKLPPDVLRVAESGVHTTDDAQRLQNAGYQAFLVGESLMQAERPGEKLRQLAPHAAVQPLANSEQAS